MGFFVPGKFFRAGLNFGVSGLSFNFEYHTALKELTRDQGTLTEGKTQYG
jgi:hypothetical protein